MNRYFAISGGLHVLAALFLLLLLAPSAKKASATYTIDFIGSGKVVATTGQEASAPKAPKAAVQAPAVAKEAQPKAEPAKTAKKAYPSAPLAAPSVLDESQAGGQSAESAEAAKEGQFAGGNIQTDFANFPYPWYITQVRNSLWIEWEKRRPAGKTGRRFAEYAENGKKNLSKTDG